MVIFASDVIPLSQARANLSELADQVKAGAEKIITKNGESYVAIIDARRLDYYHQLEREHIHLLLIDEASKGLADVAANKVKDARSAIGAIKRRRALKRSIWFRLSTVTEKHNVKLTANFERNLEEVEAFFLEVKAPQAFDALLDELADSLIPNLERFPDMGRLFLIQPAQSVEVVNGIERLRKQLLAINKNSELRQCVMKDYVLLYARTTDTLYLLSIRHQRQLSFDFKTLG